MSLIKSISGIRGTIGGAAGDNLTPIDVVKFTSAYAAWLQMQQSGKQKMKVVVGRDARISGAMVSRLVVSTLQACGVDVVNIGLATTPTVELAVTCEKAQGGIIITASHNPKQWNALKLLNAKGEFLSAKDGELLLSIAEQGDLQFAPVDELGKEEQVADFLQKHVALTLALPLVNAQAIRAARLKVVVDAVNSVGGAAIPALLRALGVEQVVELNCEPNGQFAHNPEPLPEHLTEISGEVVRQQAHIGIVVDPDVDRLALVCEDGNMFGEEYTLVAVADYVLSRAKGNTCSNLSSSRALRDVTEAHGGTYAAAAVGEVNVVEKMRQTNAVIGGEGNGGVIYPALHYGRDALVGVALFLSHYVQQGKSMSALRAGYPAYFMSKNKLTLTPDVNVDAVLNAMKREYAAERVTDVDGVRVDFDAKKEWVHLRKSNTEPIIRIYAESDSPESADALAKQVMDKMQAAAKAPQVGDLRF
ncbi:MAG: phosphoglucosamine mutase [Prevotellaceae bacterium]|jgi:phosphomannomutase|nr:phosphoglucosamine mutase [Prevotellaceae bacterium]